MGIPGKQAEKLELFRRKNHNDSPALHTRFLLKFGKILQFFHHSLNQFKPLFNVGVLATTKDDREDDFVFLIQKVLCLVDFRHEIVLTNLWAEPQFLVLALMGMALVLPFFLLVFELTVVHDPANWGFF